MNYYKAFYKDKQTTVTADSSRKAQSKAAVLFKAPRDHQVKVFRVTKDGKPTHG